MLRAIKQQVGLAEFRQHHKMGLQFHFGRPFASGAAPKQSGFVMEQDCLMESMNIREKQAGTLHGKNIVVKDSYDIQGYPTSNGSPDWRRTHKTASHTATSVQKLLDAGACITGKAVMDEMAYALEGRNYHYGTPINPACPDRIPGGSSSGTAVATRKGIADIGLGGDTAGSVRIPASFCGLYGMRPTHGRVDLTGSCALAPSFDTGGWFARRAIDLELAGGILLDPTTAVPTKFKKWLVAKDMFELCDSETAKAIYEVLSNSFDIATMLFGSAPEEVMVAPKSLLSITSTATNSDLGTWVEVFRICQGYEVWQTHGQWVVDSSPAFGPGVRERFDMASKISYESYADASTKQHQISMHLSSLLKDSVLTVPTSVGPAPRLATSNEEMEAIRRRLISLTCVSSLGGLPEITIPLAEIDGCPVGMSLIGPPGSDEDLLSLAVQIERERS